MPAPAASATAQALRTVTAEHEVAELHGAAQKARELEAEVLALRQELAALKQRCEGPAAAPTGAPNCPAEIRQELERLAIAVEGLQRKNLPVPAEEPKAALPGAEADNHVISPLAVFLGVLGIVLGTWLGSRYVRKQERSRRSRLRF